MQRQLMIKTLVCSALGAALLGSPLGADEAEAGSVSIGSSVVVTSGTHRTNRTSGGRHYYHGYVAIPPSVGSRAFRDGYYYDDYYWDRYDRYDPLYMDTATLVELARRLDPQLVNPNAAPAESDASDAGETREERFESARQAMLNQQFDEAIAIYAELSDEQRRSEAEADTPAELRDASAQRLLALAYARNNNFELAAENFREAYERDGSLAQKPLRGSRFFADESELERLVRRAVTNAHREKTADAWYLVAMLMQSQGRYERANRMMQRAESMNSTLVPETDTPEHTDLPEMPEVALDSPAAGEQLAAG